jgi:uncharacterized membrane protein YfcA
MYLFLVSIISLSALIFAFYYLKDAYKHRKEYPNASWVPLSGIGFVANFFDTLGIGSFATTTAFYKFTKLVDDRVIPGTLNTGLCLPVVAQSLLFLSAVQVEPVTLISMMASATLGAVLGAGVVSKLPVNKIRLGLGSALLLVAMGILAGLLNLFPSGGDAFGLTGVKLIVAIAGNFILGSLMTIGVGLYAPCMALTYALGMNPLAAFPIMTGSCALLQPWASLKFVKEKAYHPKAAFGLTAAGIFGVLIAFFIVKSLPLTILKWVIVVVIVYTSVTMFRSITKRKAAAAPIETGRSGS